MSRKLKVLDLFAGIGGFALGLDSTDFFETVKFVEKDKYCQKVLQKNFPNIPIEEDIKNVKGKEGDADVIVGGFPCQPMSVAGKRKGTDDDRYLWPEMFRLIREIKPQFVIGENVKNIVNIQDGVVFETVCTDLESEGYEVQSFNIPAAGVGAPHRRERIWIVAYAERYNETQQIQKSDGTQDQVQNKRGQKDSTSRISSRANSIRQTNNRYEKNVANAYSERPQGHGKKYELRKNSQKIKTSGSSSSARNTNVADTESSDRHDNEAVTRDGESQTQEVFGDRSSLSGESSWWHTEPNVGRVAHGIPGRVHRLKGLGNAIVPQIAREFGLAIKKVLSDEDII